MTRWERGLCLRGVENSKISSRYGTHFCSNLRKSVSNDEGVIREYRRTCVGECGN